MSIWTTTARAANTQTFNVSKTRVTTMTLSATGLLPNSTFTLWVNGVDMTWAARTPGAKQGAGLTSDDSGSMTVLYSCEMVNNVTGSNQGGTTKYHSLQLKDVKGNVKSLSVIQQNFAKK